MRRVWLDNKADLDLTPVEDEFTQLIINLGLAHEQSILEILTDTLKVHTATSSEDTEIDADCRISANCDYSSMISGRSAATG